MLNETLREQTYMEICLYLFHYCSQPFILFTTIEFFFPKQRNMGFTFEDFEFDAFANNVIQSLFSTYCQ